MTLQTKEQQLASTQVAVTPSDSHMDQGFANKLEGMLAGLAPTKAAAQVKPVEQGSVTLDEVMVQANDGIALAQTIEACILDCSQILLQMFNHIQQGIDQSALEQAVFSNDLLYLKEQLQQRVDDTRFNGTPVFQKLPAMHVATSLTDNEKLTLHIPKLNSHEIGIPTWQAKAGVHTPRRAESSVQYRFNETLIEENDRIRLVIEGHDLVQEYMHDMATTLQVVASLINNAQLQSISSARADNSELTMNLAASNTAYTGQLFVESQSVASEHSVAAIYVTDENAALDAMQVISGAMNMYADYRDQVNMVAEQIHGAVESLMSAPIEGHYMADMEMPLAQAVAKDVGKMIEQNGVQGMLALGKGLENEDKHD